MPGWATDMVGVFLGASLGALFGYGFSWWQARRETQARRAVLFRTLSDQLHAIPTDEPAFGETVLLTRGTIHVSAASELLNGETLDTRKDARLIKLLILWQSFEASHNELARITNQAAVTMSVPREYRATWHQSLNNSLKLLIALRHDVLSALPPEYQSPSWSQNREKDKGLLFRFRVDDLAS